MPRFGEPSGNHKFVRSNAAIQRIGKID